jgi:hypothetical protein
MRSTAAMRSPRQGRRAFTANVLELLALATSSVRWPRSRSRLRICRRRSAGVLVGRGGLHGLEGGGQVLVDQRQ